MEIKWVKSRKEITPEVLAQTNDKHIVIRKAKSKHAKAKKLFGEH